MSLTDSEKKALLQGKIPPPRVDPEDPVYYQINWTKLEDLKGLPKDSIDSSLLTPEGEIFQTESGIFQRFRDPKNGNIRLRRISKDTEA